MVKLNKLYLGGTEINKAYLGSTTVLDNTAPSGPAFTPADLFANGEAGAWYDPSDLSTLWQDDAGTVAVTVDGDPVRRMDDQSGNAHHAIAPSDGARPLYRTDGTRHWLDFDGVDDYLDTGAAFFAGTTARAAILGVRKEQNPRDPDDVLIGNTGNSSGEAYALTAEIGLRVFNGFELFEVSSLPTPSVITHTLAANVSTGSGAAFLNGSSLGLSDSRSIGIDTNNSSIRINYDTFGGSASRAAEISRIVLIARELTTSERQQAEQWAADSIGVTL